MPAFAKPFLLSFLALFVAIDVVAVVPLYISLTENFSDLSRKRMLTKALMTAAVVALLFLLLGNFIFIVFGITEADFKVGGGIVLLTVSVIDLVSNKSEEGRSISTEDMGVVPIGIPLVMGPAALTSILASSSSNGFIVTLLSLIINLVIVWFVFRNSRQIRRVIGDGASRAMGKVASLFLTSIAVAMIRSGVQQFLANK